MPAAKTKCLPLYVDRDLYARLEQQARQNERIAEQEAAWILKQALPPRRGGADDPPCGPTAAPK